MILGTSNTDLLNALQTALGPAPSYQINSAMLTIGSTGDNYAPTNGVTAHLLLVTYNTSQTTWFERATGTNWSTPGLASGVDYASANLSTPTPNGVSKTDFTGLGLTVQNWLNVPSSNAGIFFLATSDGTSVANYTAYTNVVWTLDAVAVPEPSAFSLLFCAGLGLSAVRSRYTTKTRQASPNCAR